MFQGHLVATQQTIFIALTFSSREARNVLSFGMKSFGS